MYQISVTKTTVRGGGDFWARFCDKVAQSFLCALSVVRITTATALPYSISCLLSIGQARLSVYSTPRRPVAVLLIGHPFLFCTMFYLF